MLQPGLMMDRPLLLSGLIEHAAANYGGVEIVSRENHGPLHRYTYRDCAARARRLANALMALGLERGTSVATLAWNHYRHLEAYYGVSGNGMILHTCNPRLVPQQLIYIINHADDRVLLFDSSFAALIKGLAPHCPNVRAWICLSDRDHMPVVEGVTALLCYEDLLAAESDELPWPEFDERSAAALCYTSGTTGNPKGVLYSHRSLVLSSLVGALPGVVSLSNRDTVLPVVPMFHVNAWCIPYAATLGGAKLVFPGLRLDAAGLHELMEAERVTVSAGVPTIWLALIQYVEQHGLRFSTMRRTLVGGSAMPLALIAKFADVYGVEVRHGWGMTETSGGASLSSLNTEQLALPAAARHAISARQGSVFFGNQLRIVDESGAPLPEDGIAQGELQARGLAIIDRYFKEGESPLKDGWFPTGDIATIDADGSVQIRDRVKDVIKSGGEWISSIDLENAAMAHPAVALAAVIGVSHPHWQERPLLFIVRKPEQPLERDDILAFLAGRIAKWWLPDEVIFVPSLELGGTGKVQKAALRQQYADFLSRSPS
jgi:fatty-acyl-CoA synthase